MKKKGYVPTQLLKRLEWLEELVNQLKIDGATFGIDPKKTDDLEKFVKKLREEMDKGIAIENAAKSQTEKTKTADKTATAEARDIAQKMKTNDNYTDDVGKRYGIIGEDNTPDIPNSMPVIELRKVATGWEVAFNLLGFFDGVKIYRKRPGEPKTYLATDTSSPYIDTDPMVEGTSYTAWFLIGDDAVGKESSPVTVGVKEE